MASATPVKYRGGKIAFFNGSRRLFRKQNEIARNYYRGSRIGSRSIGVTFDILE